MKVSTLKMHHEHHPMRPTRQIAISFLAVILIGSVLLMLPICNNTTPTAYLNNLFIATSATCVTGLVPVVTSEQFNILGQIVIIILIQIGGLGFLTFLNLLLIIAAFFGVFQALMPALGYVLGTTFANKIAAIDHWIAFILLALIGANMIKEALSSDDDECQDDSLRLGDLIMLSIATSIDALAVGITFAFFNVSLLLSVSMIGIITFIICVIGVKVGNVFGEKYKSKAELAGGLILIVMGAKILIDHLFF